MLVAKHEKVIEIELNPSAMNMTMLGSTDELSAIAGMNPEDLPESKWTDSVLLLPHIVDEQERKVYSFFEFQAEKTYHHYLLTQREHDKIHLAFADSHQEPEPSAEPSGSAADLADRQAPTSSLDPVSNGG